MAVERLDRVFYTIEKLMESGMKNNFKSIGCGVFRVRHELLMVMGGLWIKFSV